jgi:tetratricopeptide (TPR) repeat protein
MPKRPRSHQLEEESINNLGNLLPKNWLLSRSNKDYGIDGQIEIFDKNNESTGVFFFFQIKATDNQQIKNILNYQIKKETILYYKKLQIPVLIIRYSSFQKQFYYKWAHSVDFYYSKPISKTISIKFLEKWDQKQSPENIIEYINFYNRIIRNPGDIKIDFYFNMPSEELFSFSKAEIFVSLKQKIKKISEFIDISINLKDDYFSKIEIKNNTLSIDIGGVAGFNIHHLNKYYSSTSFKKYITNDILVGIGYVLLKIGYDNIVIDNLFRSYILKSTAITKIKNFFNEEIIYLFLKTNRFKRLDLLNRIIKINNDINISHNINFISLLQKEEYGKDELNKLKEIITYSAKILEERNSLEELGTLYYNFGNILRKYIENKKESLNYYKKAAKNDPNYFKRPYYWKELAGIYFVLGNYSTSELYYKKALKLGSPTSVIALRADALMFYGRYRDSYNLFNEYINKEKEIDCRWCLKSKFLKTIIREFKIENQKRKPNESKKIFSSDLNKASLPEFEEKLQKAFDYDILDNLTWFNKGNLEIRKKNYFEALISFLFAALIDSNDLESWAMFIKINLKKKFNDELFFCGLKLAYQFHGESLLTHLIHWFNNKPEREISKKQKIKFINELTTYLNNIAKEKREEKIIRFILPDGKYFEHNIGDIQI